MTDIPIIFTMYLFPSSKIFQTCQMSIKLNKIRNLPLQSAPCLNYLRNAMWDILLPKILYKRCFDWMYVCLIFSLVNHEVGV